MQIAADTFVHLVPARGIFKIENPPETKIESKKRSFNELVECEKDLNAAREENNEKRNKIILFILCSLGILIFYLLFGILQVGFHGHFSDFLFQLPCLNLFNRKI